MTQTDIILEQLRAGSTVTNLTAYHIGIGNIREVIRRLRLSGWAINTEQRQDATGRRYVAYVLDEKVAA